MPSGGTKTTIEPGLIARIAQGVRYAFGGPAPEAWFGPQQPMAPLVPEDQKPSVTGRQFDFPFAYNQRIKPRQEEPVSFEQMRALADGYDLLRLVIETRKDQMSKLRWCIKPRDRKAKDDSGCKAVADFLRFPDREHSWDDWLRMLLEDMLVIDAATLYARPTLGGDLYALEPIDGSTIKRVLDEHGRTPMAPDPAYQQILKGVPAIDYTRDELIYRPRNVRTHKVYGYSPVEQVIMTVNIALRRQAYQLSYYTEGNVPEALASVPKEWQPDQIRQFQEYWDTLLSGDMGQRRKLKFIPDGVNYKETKESPLKDTYDEWLARIVCFAFSVSPQPFVKETNRATASTAKEAELTEGLAPIMQWAKNMVDFVIAGQFKRPDLEFDWEEEESVDPLVQAQVMQIQVAAKIITPDEARADLGRDPMTPEEREAAFPAPPAPVVSAAPGEPDAPSAKPPAAKGKEALSKASKKALAGLDRPAAVDATEALKAVTSRLLKNQAPKIAAQVADLAGLEKALTMPGQSGGVRSPKKIDAILAGIDFGEWIDEFYDDAVDVLAGLAVDSGIEAMSALEVFGADEQALLRTDAIKWAEGRAAEMVGMRKTADGLIQNPNAKWQITEGTRGLIRADVTTALDEGWSSQELASALADSYAFSDERSETIARTEIARADVEGNTAGWRATGLVAEKEWLTAPECCDICDEMNGKTAPLDEDFEGGASMPLHPNCRCTALPVLKDQTEDQ